MAERVKSTPEKERIDEVVKRAERWSSSPNAPRDIKESADVAMRTNRELERARIINPDILREPISK
jgi:hypothetical protein